MHERFTIHPAKSRDHADFARFFVELGHDDAVPEPARWELEFMPHTFFLEEAGVKVGYAYVEHFGERGYIRHVVVDKLQRGKGAGRALMEAIALRLRERGARAWELNVMRGNVPAIRLYEAFGMREQYSTFVLRLDWSAANDLPRAAQPLRALVVEPADDAEVEQRFGLPTGQPARFRALPGQVLMRLADAELRTRAFARFDPSFPGAFPFRVTDTTDVQELLAALRPHARPEHTWIQLVIEDHAPSATLLRERGARLMFEIIHMQGVIP
ncbi:MAG: GNAT family N-acetyltransferase [Planctomycetes bacterium]|nr:GNAT family N-acetyltransferase [Planctomycetota bacterium]